MAPPKKTTQTKPDGTEEGQPDAENADEPWTDESADKDMSDMSFDQIFAELETDVHKWESKHSCIMEFTSLEQASKNLNQHTGLPSKYFDAKVKYADGSIKDEKVFTFQSMETQLFVGTKKADGSINRAALYPEGPRVGMCFALKYLGKNPVANSNKTAHSCIVYRLADNKITGGK